mgnify:CR=1 FL=1
MLCEKIVIYKDGMFMRKKNVFIAIFIIFILMLVGYICFNFGFEKSNGSTVEGREKMINSNSNPQSWNIAKEVKIDKYIISGIHFNNKSGIAIFENIKGDNYKLNSTYQNYSNNIILTGVFVDDIWYDICWFNGASTDYAEFIYTDKNGNVEKIKFETDDMNVIYSKSPFEEEYTLKVVYYDEFGNIYE